MDRSLSQLKGVVEKENDFLGLKIDVGVGVGFGVGGRSDGGCSSSPCVKPIEVVNSSNVFEGSNSIWREARQRNLM